MTRYFSHLANFVLGFVTFLFLERTAMQSLGAEATSISPVVFVVLSQPTHYHKQIAKKKKADIIAELHALNRAKDKVLIAPTDFKDVLGYWIIIPLFERLVKYHDTSWVVFLEDRTELSLKRLFPTLSNYSEEKDLFLGHGLKDAEPTIIHHFDTTEEDKALIYPDFSAGFAISFPLIKKASEKWKKIDELGFSIDAKYELAKFFLQEFDGLRLTNDSHFCLTRTNKECATWVQKDFPSCKLSLSKNHVIFAVKTCKKYHGERVPVVKGTWGLDARKIIFFSDVDDPSIPTVNLGVKNVEIGHCEKTMSIIRYLNSSDSGLKWIVIADDDTLISIPRLVRLLSCYDPSKSLALGERYGYQLINNRGYDYITGGGGMVFSISVIKKLASYCVCPSLNAPDDMIIGICLKELGIPVVHSLHFHQARPEDYNQAYLSHHKPVSFHKHWMVDPYSVYKTWLNVAEDEHDEL